MKRFMETNKVTHNLMSFSGFKTLLIFSLLAEGPKTYKEIQKAIEENEYLHETVSFDTIRVYFNSLKEAGCTIKTQKQGKLTRYYIESHPFKLRITDKQAQSIIKIFKAISKSIEITDFLVLQQFFMKISQYITNDELKLRLENMSPLSNINSQLIKDLIHYSNKKTGIKILYNSPKSGIKEINIIPDKLSIKNNKLYLSGYNKEHKNYYSFLVPKIIKIISADITPTELNIPILTVRYVYTKADNTDFEPNKDEKIIEQNGNKITVEISSKNEFTIAQRILSLSNKCEVLSPSNYREQIIKCLKRMKEGYND